MSCILRIAGENFNVDDFVSISGIVPYKVFYKNTPKYNTKPDGSKHEYSGCQIETSNADMDNFDQQLKDSVNFLSENNKTLLLIKSTPSIQFAVLDFGVNYDQKKFVQSHHLNNALLKLVADLSISIELSVYQSDE